MITIVHEVENMAITFRFFMYNNMNSLLLAILFIITNAVLVLAALIKVKNEKWPNVLLVAAGGLNIFTHISWFFQPTGFTCLTAEFMTAVSIMTAVTVTIPCILYIIGYGGLVSATGLFKLKNNEDGAFLLLTTGALWGVGMVLLMISNYMAIDFLYVSHDIPVIIGSTVLEITYNCLFIAGAGLLLLYGFKIEDKLLMIAGLAFIVMTFISLITAIIGVIGAVG